MYEISELTSNVTFQLNSTHNYGKNKLVIDRGNNSTCVYSLPKIVLLKSNKIIIVYIDYKNFILK